MAFIKTTSPADAAGPLRDMYERQQQTWGFVPNYAKVFCHRPEVMARWGRLLAEIKRPMSPRRFELVTFVVAVELRNTACALAHGKALAEYVGDEAVLAIAAGDDEDLLSDAERAMLRFARQVAKDASRVTAGQVAALRAQGYDDDEIFDIAATAAGRAFFTKLLDALGVEADSSVLALDDDWRRALIVGRPVDCKEPERLQQAAGADFGTQAPTGRAPAKTPRSGSARGSS